MAKAKPEAAETVAVTALVPIVYDEVRYEVGEPIDLRSECLADLLLVNAVVEAAAAAA